MSTTTRRSLGLGEAPSLPFSSPLSLGQLEPYAEWAYRGCRSADDLGHDRGQCFTTSRDDGFFSPSPQLPTAIAPKRHKDTQYPLADDKDDYPKAAIEQHVL